MLDKTAVWRHLFTPYYTY